MSRALYFLLCPIRITVGDLNFGAGHGTRSGFEVSSPYSVSRSLMERPQGVNHALKTSLAVRAQPSRLLIILRIQLARTI